MTDKSVIYLDYAATTPVDAEVIAEALPYFGASFYNPASSHIMGQIASMALERARRTALAAIGGKGCGRVVFTSGGTEAVNQAIKCAPVKAGDRIVVSAIEHDSVLACAERMKELGVFVDFVMPDADGVITPEALSKVVNENTKLVCVMTVNNNIGTIQPIKELVAVTKKYGALFFTDAVQAANAVDIDVSDSGVDMLCLSGHKFYAPKGTGLLYVKDGVKLKPLLDGGAQEYGLRAGTADVAGAVAIAEALSRAQNDYDKYYAHAHAVSNAFISALDCGEVIAKNAHKTGDIVSVAFDGVNGGRLAVALSVAGVCCSVGSACSAGSAVPPPTLTAMKVKNADGAVRFSFGKPTTLAQAAAAAKIVNETVAKLKSAKAGGGKA